MGGGREESEVRLQRRITEKQDVKRRRVRRRSDEWVGAAEAP